MIPCGERYNHFFNIDPDYFPQVNEAVIRQNPDLWKKFYPHETFVTLLKDTVSILTRKERASLWVEGAYGTGKSHAVLTLKKILDATDEEVKAYFDRYPDQLSSDLYKSLKQLKDSEQKIITVHRYGSSSIKNDDDLVFAIQESISHALEERGIYHTGQSTLREATLDWLKDDIQKKFFNELIQQKYADLFAGEDVEAIIDHLKKYTGDALVGLMQKISLVGKKQGFTSFHMDIYKLIDWIKSIIHENNLKAIVFIWDEFTEYFENNLRQLTGFQHIVEVSETDPFYLIIVTHNSTHLIGEGDTDKKKIFDRFHKPFCRIELPENMAFRLMGAAMEKNKNPQIYAEWCEDANGLYELTHDSREEVKKKAKISDKELKNILPIHPYAALILKNISSTFDSNQRSMFDFIKNDRGDDVKGFQWFIKNYGPEDEHPLLTVDMLWDFFYTTGRDHLAREVREILDCYPRIEKQLNDNEKSVFKTVLLLQAISQRVDNAVELFIPNARNLSLAYEGTSLDAGQAKGIADKLVSDHILFEKAVRSGQTSYTALMNSGDQREIAKYVAEEKNRPTYELVDYGGVGEAVALSGFYFHRFKCQVCSSLNFRTKLSRLNHDIDSTNQFGILVCFAKDDTEAADISKKIQDVLGQVSSNIVIVDTSSTPLGMSRLGEYAEAKGNAQYYAKKDHEQSRQYDSYATKVLAKWRDKIEKGEFTIYSKDISKGKRASNKDELLSVLKNIDKKRFPMALEFGTAKNFQDTMWLSSMMKFGAECGVNRVVKNTFKTTSSATICSLPEFIGEARTNPNYWKTYPYLFISKIKSHVDDYIRKAFNEDGKVSIQELCDDLSREPYGFMPCNLSAFVLGFILKEYTDNSYNWTDNKNSQPMNIDLLKNMIDQVLKHQINPSTKYTDSYIEAMTVEQRVFNEASSEIFKIPLNQCTSIEQTRNLIRSKIHSLSFPIWTVKYVFAGKTFKTDLHTLESIIDGFVGVANDENLKGGKTDTDYANEIGKLCHDHPEAADDLKTVVDYDNCRLGMDEYLKQNFGELLRRADLIQDHGQYLARLQAKIDASDANWLWNHATVDDKINELIHEYQIADETNKALGTSVHGYDEALRKWNERISYIRIPFEKLKDANIRCKEFLKELYDYANNGKLSVEAAARFLDALIREGTEFNKFYNHQETTFTELYDVICSDFGDNTEAIHKLYSRLPMNAFTMDVSNYTKQLSECAELIKGSLASEQLRLFWKKRTGTESPLAWSTKYKMPILVMVDMVDQPQARVAFATLNSKSNDKHQVESALSFLQKANFFDRLNNQDERDRFFRKKILKTYDVILPDVEKVKDKLIATVNDSPYNWNSSEQVDQRIKEMAQLAYDKNGSNMALEKIDNMDAESLKKYLRKMIKGNMTVGLEIIKEN